MGNKNLVVTIGREYGSGGRIVGEKLAGELGLNYYDEEILKLTSEKSAIGEQYFRLADEKAGNNLLYRIVGGLKPDLTEPSIHDRIMSKDNLFLFQSSVIRQLAAEESCVIVGRAADYILDQEEELEGLIKIFVYADRPKRIERVMEVDCIDEERAKKRIRKIDKERKEFYKYYTGRDWRNLKNYDLPINTTKFDLDETVELIKAYIRLKGFQIPENVR